MILETRTARAADGIRLHLEGSGRPRCLMLHGLGYASWETREMRTLLDPESGLWSVDNRGTGRSGPLTGPTSIQQLADDAAHAIDELGAPQIVIGHSMGGYIAQALAATRPEQVEGLILIGTSPGGRAATPVPPSTVDAWRAAAGAPPEEYARRTMPLSFRPGWPGEHPDAYERLLAARLDFPTPEHTWRAQFAACEDHLAHGIDPRRITVPTLVIHGTADRIVPVANGRLLALALPRAQYLEIEGAGHVVHLERPGLLAEHLMAFTTRLASTTN